MWWNSLTASIERKTDTARVQRRLFAEQAFRALLVYPLSLEIAELAGRIEGEQAAIGNTIAFEDLIIGATALHLGYALATLNTKHFERIPNLALANF